MFFLGADDWEAVILSLKVGFVSVLVSLPAGVIVGWLLSRKNFFGKNLFDALIHLPMVVPPVVMGYVLLLLFGRNGIIGASLYKFTGFSFAFNWKGAALSSAVVAFPLLVRSVRVSMDLVDLRLEEAARTLGAGSIKIFFTITAPLALPGIISGMVLCFARSLGEFGTTITFVSNIPGETRTLPLALYSILQSPDQEGRAMILAFISLLIAFISLAASEYLVRKSYKKDYFEK